MQENSRSEVAKEISEQLTDYFIEDVNKEKIHFSAKHFISTYPMHNVKANYFSRVMKSEFGKEAKIEKIGNPFLNDLNEKRCRCFTFLRGEIIKDGEVAGASPAPNADNTIFYDPDWVDGEFD